MSFRSTAAARPPGEVAAIQMIDEHAEATCQLLDHIDDPVEDSVSAVARSAMAAEIAAGDQDSQISRPLPLLDILRT